MILPCASFSLFPLIPHHPIIFSRLTSSLQAPMLRDQIFIWFLSVAMPMTPDGPRPWRIQVHSINCSVHIPLEIPAIRWTNNWPFKMLYGDCKADCASIPRITSQTVSNSVGQQQTWEVSSFQQMTHEEQNHPHVLLYKTCWLKVLGE